MLPATENRSMATWPHQSTHWPPVYAAGSPVAPIKCNLPHIASLIAGDERSTTLARSRPCASKSRPAGPYRGLTSACVASAPTPARA